MRVLVRSYDLDDLAGSGVTIREIARYLAGRGDVVLATNRHHTLDEIRAWAPDVVLAQQWATREGCEWAEALGRPFVMFVHGPEQYEQFRPRCGLVVFNTETQHALAAEALGATPAWVLHPPVFRDDYVTPGEGAHFTLLGAGEDKGEPLFLAVARAMPQFAFLLVADGARAVTPNVEVHPRVRDVRVIYARTRLLLVPSRIESYGRVAVEAAMSGIPTVATDLPGIREATAGRAVLVDPAAGPGQWERALRTTLADLAAHRRAALELARLRDPTDELARLRAALLELVAAARSPT